LKADIGWGFPVDGSNDFLSLLLLTNAFLIVEAPFLGEKTPC